MESILVQPWIAAAFILAGISATFKVQFQALMYLLAVIYGAQDFNSWLVYTFIYACVLLFNRMYAAAAS